MMRKGKQDKAICQIMFYAIFTSFVCFTLNNIILGVSADRGAWIGGNVFCQLFAYFSNSLISFSILVSTLATFERRYAVVDPDKHLQVFTPINNKLLVVGFYMLAVLLCAGPLYGWGEYSNFKGVMKILISVTLEKSTLENSTEFPLNATLSSILCQPMNGTRYHRLHDLSKKVESAVLEEWQKIYSRSMMNNCRSGQIMLVLRAENTNIADNLSQAILSNRFDDVIMEKTMNDTTGLETGLVTKSSLDRHEYQSYRDAYISFQSIGVCTLDFSPTNDYVMSATLYILCTTVIAPLLLMMMNTLIIFKYIKCPYYSLNDDVTYLKSVNFGGMATALCCVPYYVINFMNMHGIVIHRTLNILCTAMFYNASLCVTVSFLIDYIFKSCKKRSTGQPLMETTELQSIVDSAVE